ncbi:conserved hypothetical protein [Ixodes scapularis]|uniref:F5/8 type C domain-containing protein n=1 Tax=Ixodes scapularis TaxID=6945 RepID=B7QMY0_IXOSC|nr:conserved hypothetical protein [Ixodes scapularis]|eukprot:XP_002400396.1 conserved hypothetical protein [Ixodes scapularis]
MASEEIFDTQLHASSIDDSGPYHFTNARLNAEYGWCAGPSDAQRYLQVDLQNHTRITGIILQGMSTPVKSGYVIAFHLTFSNDSIYWTSEEQPVGHRDSVVRLLCGYDKLHRWQENEVQGRPT